MSDPPPFPSTHRLARPILGIPERLGLLSPSFKGLGPHECSPPHYMRPPPVTPPPAGTPHHRQEPLLGRVPDALPGIPPTPLPRKYRAQPSPLRSPQGWTPKTLVREPRWPTITRETLHVTRSSPGRNPTPCHLCPAEPGRISPPPLQPADTRLCDMTGDIVPASVCAHPTTPPCGRSHSPCELGEGNYQRPPAASRPP